MNSILQDNETADIKRLNHDRMHRHEYSQDFEGNISKTDSDISDNGKYQEFEDIEKGDLKM